MSKATEDTRKRRAMGLNRKPDPVKKPRSIGNRKEISCVRYAFITGEECSLDSIYTIQGLCGGDWWEPKEGVDERNIPYSGEVVIITRAITIEIIQYG